MDSVDMGTVKTGKLAFDLEDEPVAELEEEQVREVPRIKDEL